MWAGFFAVFADAVTDVPMMSPLGRHTLRYTKALRQAELRDDQGRRLSTWTDVSRQDGMAQARAWLDAQALADGHNPLHDDRYYARRQELA